MNPACRHVETAAHPEKVARPETAARREKTCVVLSVGGPKGVAHLGALDALRKSGVRIDCVYGNSMGALVGGLYATAPQADTTARYRELMHAYVRTTEKKTHDEGLLGALFGFGAIILSGGTLGWAALAGGAGYTHGAGAVTQLDNARMRAEMERYFGHARIESLPVPFLTAYKERRQTGLASVTATTGPLAAAIARSANNPFIFKGTDMKYLDPGSDSVAAVPIEDACRLFHPTKIIAINVTGQPAYYRQIDCAVQEIPIALGVVPMEALIGEGRDFQRAYAIGYVATMAAVKEGDGR